MAACCYLSRYVFCFILFSQQITEKEIARKGNIIKSLDLLSQQVGALNVNIPQDLEYREVVINRAMDVRSASMVFISSLIKYDKTSFGTPGRSQLNHTLSRPGKVIKTIFVGDGRVNGPEEDLKYAVHEFSDALANFHVRVSLKTHEIVRGTARSSNMVSNLDRWRGGTSGRAD